MSNVPASPLENALSRFDDTLEGRQEVLKVFMRSRVYVLLDQPWDGKALPSTDIHLLFVSDGDNKEQAMLAVFTNRGNAERVMADMDEFKYPVEVDAQWALLSVPPKIGVRINPNVDPGFKILPDLVAELRKLAEQEQARRRAAIGGAR